MGFASLKPDVYWVGAIDWAIRDFHGYITPKGSTYNNYLILDEEPTLIDGVKLEFVDESIGNIKSLIEPARIKHLVVNHIEPDHGGGLSRLLALMPKATVYCTQKGKEGLSRYHDISGWDIKVVKTGERLKIGRRTLQFIETPMVHWPDSMMTLCLEEGILFSQDGFGQHLASSQRFDDEFVACASEAEIEDSVWDYYANILMPFGGIIKNKIEEIGKLGVPIGMIAPDHGVIWRKRPEKVLGMYLDMANGKADERVVIIYDTMWGGTARMAQPIMEGLKDEGMDTRVMKLRATPLSVAIKEFWRARGCLLGSPTLNNNLFPYVGEFLIYLKGLRPKDRIVSAFGSYGWAGGAVKLAMEEFRNMKLEVYPETPTVNYRPNPEEQRACYEFGQKFARATREFHKRFL
ncbi:MAG: FprA family A-type flavoprotein [Nitrospiraceae bacterium]|nr:FprA family A-type flavoprotein [Nitrospiraceae bacterium]